MGRDVLLFIPPEGMSPVEAIPLNEDDRQESLGTRQSILEAFRSVATEVDVSSRRSHCNRHRTPLRSASEIVLNVYGTDSDVVIREIAQSLDAVAYDIAEGRLVL